MLTGILYVRMRIPLTPSPSAHVLFFDYASFLANIHQLPSGYLTTTTGTGLSAETDRATAPTSSLFQANS